MLKCLCLGSKNFAHRYFFFSQLILKTATKMFHFAVAYLFNLLVYVKPILLTKSTIRVVNTSMYRHPLDAMSLNIRIN